ncbi:hypothetical protein AOC41_14925 [Listeria monocytogenes]|nr:hypothetical protein [Listeria monocytogenes]EAE9170442.1 hypothetical protein [Listeria monocytogenes]
MSFPTLYKADDVDILRGIVPTNNGLGCLTNISEAVVSEERQGAFTFTFIYYSPSLDDDDYDLQKVIFDNLVKRAIIKVKVNDFDGEKLFRIDESEFDTIGGFKTITSIAIGQYDLASNSFVSVDKKNTTPAAALNAILNSAVVKNNYSAWTDVTSTGNFNLSYKSISEAIAGTEGSIIDTWRTDLEWDNFTIKLHKSRGENRGVRIEFGKNLLGLTETITGDVVTRIIPFANIDDGGGGQLEISLKEVVIDAENIDETEVPLALPVDFSQEMTDKGYTTESQLRTLAKEYFKTSTLNVPKVNIDVDFIQLSKTEEYKKYAVLEQVALFDTVEIWHTRFNKKIEAKVNKYTYDPIDELYLSLELGDTKYSLNSKAESDARNVDNLSSKIDNTYSFIQTAISKATDLITGNDGGYVVMYPPRRPAEILIMDTDDVNTAQQVLRLNKSGIGFSSAGVNGPFETAWTLDGDFNANFITAGKIKAVDIEGVTISGAKFAGKDMTLENGLIITNDNKGIQGQYNFGDAGEFDPRHYEGTYKMGNRMVRFLSTQWNLDSNGNKINNSKKWVASYYGPNFFKIRSYDQEGGNLLSRVDMTSDYMQVSKNWADVTKGSGAAIFADGTIYGRYMDNVSDILATRTISIKYANNGITSDFNVGGDGTSGRIHSQAIYDRTYSSSANVVVTSAGTLGRSTSAKKYKRFIQDAEVASYKLLKLAPKKWIDKNLVNCVASQLKRYPKKSTIEHKYDYEYGFIAEDLEEIGLSEFVIYKYNDDGSKEVEGIQYERLTVPLLEIAKNQQKELENLNERIEKIEEALVSGGC